MSMGVHGTRLGTLERVTGHETAERRRRLALTRRSLAAASGVELARLAAHEDGRVALGAEELEAIDAVLRPRERELGLPSVRPEYAPGSGASEARDEQIRRDVLRMLFAPESARCAAAETPPGGQQNGAGPSKADPVSDVDLHSPDQRFAPCPPSA